MMASADFAEDHFRVLGHIQGKIRIKFLDGSQLEAGIWNVGEVVGKKRKISEVPVGGALSVPQ